MRHILLGLIALQQGLGDAREIFGGVDVVGAAGIGAFDQRDEAGMSPEEGAGTGVSPGQGEDLRPVLARDQDRVPRRPS